MSASPSSGRMLVVNCSLPVLVNGPPCISRHCGCCSRFANRCFRLSSLAGLLPFRIQSAPVDKCRRKKPFPDMLCPQTKRLRSLNLILFFTSTSLYHLPFPLLPSLYSSLQTSTTTTPTTTSTFTSHSHIHIHTHSTTMSTQEQLDAKRRRVSRAW